MELDKLTVTDRKMQRAVDVLNRAVSRYVHIYRKRYPDAREILWLQTGDGPLILVAEGESRPWLMTVLREHPDTEVNVEGLL